MTFVEAIFWISLCGILYSYVGYPVLLWLVSGLHRLPDGLPAREASPSIALVVSAYNEEEVIRSKIENMLSLDYPSERLEIVIVSDGSTDRTCEIVREYADRGVVLRHYDDRRGKTACLNSAMQLVSSDVVVFSDANSVYPKGALRALVQPFHDPSVGFVTGWTRYGSSEMSASDSLGVYSMLELLTKTLESRIWSCIGADGAIFAIRRVLYSPLNDYDINDFVIPLSINLKGYRGVLQKDAVCFEKDAGSAKGEFRRQVRISNRTIRAIVNYRQLLNPFRFAAVAFALFSHKVSRFLVPALMLTVFVSNLFLLDQGGFYIIVFALQLAFYAAGAVAWLGPEEGRIANKLGVIKTFVMVNAAIALAWVKYLQGETYTTWAPTKR